MCLCRGGALPKGGAGRVRMPPALSGSLDGAVPSALPTVPAAVNEPVLTLPRLPSRPLALQGFPTLLFFPAEKDAEPIPYDGGRTLGVSGPPLPSPRVSYAPHTFASDPACCVAEECLLLSPGLRGPELPCTLPSLV